MNNSIDWQVQRDLAVAGRLDEIDPGVYIRNYSSINKIAAHHARPKFRAGIEVIVHYGVTHSGKSHGVFTKLEADGIPYYVKDSMTKWWDGYKGETICVMDEFRGSINIDRILSWWDKYPLSVEVKGTTVPLNVTKFYVMSNLAPEDWYPDLDPKSREAYLRRITKKTKYVLKWGAKTLDEELDDLFNVD